MKKKLTGIKEIATHVKRSEPTVMDWILHCDFPAQKTSDGIWEADLRLVVIWMEQHPQLFKRPEPRLQTRKAPKW